jgi:hypothetical protein
MWMAALAAAAPAAQPDLGAWTFKDLGPTGNGATHYFVAQVPAEADVVGLADKPAKPELAVRCDQKGFFVTFLWPDYVTADTYDGKVTDVDYKLDGGKLQHAKLAKVDQAAIAFGKAGYRFAKDIEKGAALTIHLPDFHGGQDATFPIKGLDAIYARIALQGCGKN